MTPNRRQRQAIDANGRELLISASAGTGKTSTMCRRILHRITRENDPLTLDRMLIVTFTVASSADMRRQLAKTLREALADEQDAKKQSRIKAQLRLLPSAQICTIDSFCLDLVRAHFDQLDLSPRLRIVNKAEGMRIKNRAMKKAMEALYADEKDGALFCEMTDGFLNAYSDRELPAMLVGLCAYFENEDEGIDLLLKIAGRIDAEKDRPFGEGKAGKTIAEKNRSKFDFYIGEFERYLGSLQSEDRSKGGVKGNADTSRFYLDLARSAREKADDPKDFSACFQRFEKIKLIPQKTEEYKRFSYIVKSFKKLFEKRSSLNIDFEFSERAAILEKEAGMLRLLHRLFKNYEEEAETQKKLLSTFEFSDIEHFALKLLYEGGKAGSNGKKTELAIGLSEDYDEIYIDEYQDVTPLQNRIFEALSRGNRYMVGDIKQSIYAFRGACPEIFSEMRKDYPMLEEGDSAGGKEEDKGENRTGGARDCKKAAVYFGENYRCAPPIVDFVNKVSRGMLSFCTDMTYKDEDDLICSRKDKDSGNLFKKPTICLINAKSPLFAGEIIKNDEAVYTARCVRAMIESGTKAEDVAILVRKVSMLSELKSAFDREGIRLDLSKVTSFFSNPEVSVLRNVLEMINNPSDDVYLAGAMKSPVFGFTLDEILAIRGNESKKSLFSRLKAFEQETGNEKCKELLAFIGENRRRAKEWTADRLTFHVMQTCGMVQLLSYGQDKGRAEEIRDNLFAFYDMIRTISSETTGELGKVLSRVEEMANANEAGEGKTSTQIEGHVRAMTIHVSKGLEFPVCWVYGCGKPFFSNGSQNKIESDKDFGACFRIRDSRFPQLRLKSENYTAIGIRKKESLLNEELRLLYVAFTRAQDRLFISGTVSKDFEGNAAVLSQLSYAGSGAVDFSSSAMNLLALVGACKGDLAEVCTNAYPEGLSPLPAQEKAVGEAAPEVGGENSCDDGRRELKKRIEKRLSFVYPHSAASELPAKKAVSMLYPAMLDDETGEIETLDVGGRGDESAAIAKTQEIKPRFILKKEGVDADDTPALRGSATHAFMQFCSFDNFEKKGFDAEAKRLKDRKFLDEAALKRVDRKGVERFFESDLYKMIKDAKSLYREQRFMISLPASDFTTDELKKEELKGEDLLVQGVIDGFFVSADGRVVLFDYKTDSFSKEELKDREKCAETLRKRHREQLSYYREAVCRMLKKPVDVCCIYSFALSKEVYF